jgi:putative hydrolase of the HAD superfamily
LKARYRLRIAAVSNEGRELTKHRIRKFRLTDFIDFFVSSCYVHIRKPDEDIFRIALDLSEAAPEEVLYIEDRAMFIEVAAGLGIRGILHRDYETTKAALAAYGLAL